MTSKPKILIAIDPGSQKTGVAVMRIIAREGYLPNASEVTLLDVSGLIRTRRRDELPVRLYDIATQLTAILTNCIGFHFQVMDLVGIVVEDPRDFPNQIRRRTADGPDVKVSTSAGTHVTLGAAFGVCLTVAQQVASQHALGTVQMMGSQKWWPRNGSKKLSHDDARDWIARSWPGLEGKGDDVVFAGGMGLQWYVHHHLNQSRKP